MNTLKNAIIGATVLMSSLASYASLGGGSVKQCIGEGAWDGTRDSAAAAIVDFCNRYDNAQTNYDGAHLESYTNGWAIWWENKSGGLLTLNRQDCFDIGFNILDTCQPGSYMKRGGLFNNNNSLMWIQRK